MRSLLRSSRLFIIFIFDNIYSIMANTDPHVLIAGGGPSGLLASILLNNIGISSTVVERAKEPDEWCSKSYTLVLGVKGKSALERAFRRGMFP